jgi:hypothetical protein
MQKPEIVLASGTKIITHTSLNDTFPVSWEGSASNLEVRRPGAPGEIAGLIPGFMSNAYWVRHPWTVMLAPYLTEEFELAVAPAEPAPASDIKLTVYRRRERYLDQVHDLVTGIEHELEELLEFAPDTPGLDDLTAPVFIRAVLGAILTDDPSLLDCAPKALLAATLQLFRLGLVPDGALRTASLLPAGKGVRIAVGYQGFIRLARLSIHQVKEIRVHGVYQGEDLKVDCGLRYELFHRPVKVSLDSRTADALVGAYGVVITKNDHTYFQFLDAGCLSDIMAVSNHVGRTTPAMWERFSRNLSLAAAVRSTIITCEGIDGIGPEYMLAELYDGTTYSTLEFAEHGGWLLTDRDRQAAPAADAAAPARRTGSKRTAAAAAAADPASAPMLTKSTSSEASAASLTDPAPAPGSVATEVAKDPQIPEGPAAEVAAKSPVLTSAAVSTLSAATSDQRQLGLFPKENGDLPDTTSGTDPKPPVAVGGPATGPATTDDTEHLVEGSPNAGATKRRHARSAPTRTPPPAASAPPPPAASKTQKKRPGLRGRVVKK